MKILWTIFVYVQTTLHTAKKTSSSAVISLQMETVRGIINEKCGPVRKVLSAWQVSLPSKIARSDEDSSDKDDIDNRSETDSTELKMMINYI